MASYAWPQQNKSSTLRCYLSLVTVYNQFKTLVVLFTEILMIKESCNLTGQNLILAANLKVYVIPEEKILLFPWNSIDISF